MLAGFLWGAWDAFAVNTTLTMRRRRQGEPEQAVVGQDQGHHGFHHGDRPGRDAGVMPAAG